MPEYWIKSVWVVSGKESPSEEKVEYCPHSEDQGHYNCEDEDSEVHCFEELLLLLLRRVFDQVRKDERKPSPVVSHADSKDQVYYSEETTVCLHKLVVRVKDVPVVCDQGHEVKRSYCRWR